MPVDFNSARQAAKDYRVAVTCTTAMAKGDLVDAQSDGTVARAAAGSTTITGVVLEFRWVDANLIARKGTYLPAVNGLGYTDIWAVVVDDPMVLFVGQANSDTVASQVTHIGNNCDHIDAAPTSVGEYQGHSNQEVDIDTAPATTGATLRIENQFPLEDNAFGTSTTNNLHGRYVVRIAEHFRAPAGATVVAATPAAGV